MNKSTIQAALKAIFDRWPWPDGTEEFQQDYTNDLRLAVGDWTGKRAESFKKAVQAALSDRHRGRARPSVEDLVASSMNRAGEGSKPTNELDPVELARDRERRNREWRESCERRRADPAERDKAVESLMRGAVLWRAGSPQRRHIAEWLRDFWGVECTQEEFDAFVNGPSTQRPRQPRSKKPGQPQEGDPVPVGAVVAEMTSGGMSGLTDAVMGSTIDDKRKRAAEHRERVRRAAEDYMASRKDREEEVNP